MTVDELQLKEIKSCGYSMHVIAMAMGINNVSPDIPAKYTDYCHL